MLEYILLEDQGVQGDESEEDDASDCYKKETRYNCNLLYT